MEELDVGLSGRLLSGTMTVTTVYTAVKAAALTTPRNAFSASRVGVANRTSQSMTPGCTVLALNVADRGAGVGTTGSGGSHVVDGLVDRLTGLNITGGSVCASDVSVGPADSCRSNGHVGANCGMSGRMAIGVGGLSGMKGIISTTIDTNTGSVGGLSFRGSISRRLSSSLAARTVRGNHRGTRIVTTTLNHALKPMGAISVDAARADAVSSNCCHGPMVLGTTLRAAAPMRGNSLVISRSTGVACCLR